ncbi:MAG: glycosyltransferase [bacterium]|nr:glycosyltransferase [bacterium]
MESPVKKKILFVITKSNWGGAQKYVYDLATHLPKDIFNVKVYFGGTGEPNANFGILATNLSRKGIPNFYLPDFIRDISFFREWKILFQLIEIFWKENKEKNTVVHLNSSKAGGIGAVAAWVAGIKNIVFTVHGWPFLEDRPVVVKAFIWLASWFTVLLCHTVICISEYDLRIAKRMPFVGDKAVRIYNGIAPISFGTGAKIRTAFPSGVKVTGTVGELTHNKNQIALIEEAKNNPSMYVAIVGFGEDYTMLDEQIKKYGLQNRVKLFGFVPVEEALKGFDVFTLPSLKEGLPYVLLEAKMAGLPIVANRIGGVGEILDAKDMNEFSLGQMIQKTIALYN